jgi:hypothetical protein
MITQPKQKKLPHTKAVLLERAQRIRIAAMRAKHEVAILRSGVQLSGGRTGGMARTLEARANAWEAKADRLVKEAMELGEDHHQGDSHQQAANNVGISRA